MSSVRQIAGIQYLRGIAACGVVVAHADATASFPKYFGTRLLGGALDHASAGVPLFFLISGFIITIVSLRPGDAAPRVSVRDYALRRALRILPIMWVAIGAYAALHLLGRGEADWWSTLRALALWPVGELAPNLIWTLRHEAIFYVLFAATFLGPRMARFLLPLWFVSPLLYAAAGLPEAPQGGLAELGWTLFHPCGLQFGAGLALGLVWLRWSRERTLRAPWLWPLSIAYFAAVVAGLAWLRPESRLAADIVTGAAFLPLLALATHAAPERASRIGLLLGDASFSIYLFHPAALSATLTGLAALAPGTPPAVAIALTALAGIGFGLAAYFAVERPLLAWLRGMAARRRGAAAAVPRADAW